MSSEEDFRRLGLGITMLEEKLEELKTYSQEMERDKTKFDPDVLDKYLKSASICCLRIKSII